MYIAHAHQGDTPACGSGASRIGRMAVEQVRSSALSLQGHRSKVIMARPVNGDIVILL